MVLLTLELVIVFFGSFIGATEFYDENYDFKDIYVRNDSYHGEKFPEKYLSVEGIMPTITDLTAYEENLLKIVSYFAEKPNETDPNVGVGLFFTKATLKRTLLDYGEKITDSDKLFIEEIIKKSEFYLSHLVYYCNVLDKKNLMRQLANLFRLDEPVIHAIGKFNKDVLKQWIKSNFRLHDYIEEMDDMSFDRFDYVSLVASMNDIFAIHDSDRCISSISSHAVPIKYDEMVQCQWDFSCLDKVLKMPSYAYILSHRLIYILGLYLSRRCYVVSEEIDLQHMGIMCANMYRETVYLARRGFFFRDIFMEHIALCGLLGYEEFHRHKWFKKILTWIDEDGCIAENLNFEVNITAIYKAKNNNHNRMKRKTKKRERKPIIEDCAHHQMAVSTIVLAHAIRHTIHYL